MRLQGEVTRGTTNPNRLRRVDRWIAWRCGSFLGPASLAVDLGYGSSPITTLEMLRWLPRGVTVVGLEIDPSRVAAAKPFERPGLRFERGGFELAGLRPNVVRAFNVLRQYDESVVASAWATMTSRLADKGFLIEGTCDELGRICAWATLRAGSTEPESISFAAKLSTLESPAVFAERLPKALIHHNVHPEPIHALLQALTDAWHRAAPIGVFGPRQRWLATIEGLGLPTLDNARRWRLGEVTFPWPTP